jgi:hypothetical protein
MAKLKILAAALFATAVIGAPAMAREYSHPRHRIIVNALAFPRRASVRLQLRPGAMATFRASRMVMGTAAATADTPGTTEATLADTAVNSAA